MWTSRCSCTWMIVIINDSWLCFFYLLICRTLLHIYAPNNLEMNPIDAAKCRHVKTQINVCSFDFILVSAVVFLGARSWDEQEVKLDGGKAAVRSENLQKRERSSSSAHGSSASGGLRSAAGGQVPGQRTGWQVKTPQEVRRSGGRFLHEASIKWSLFCRLFTEVLTVDTETHIIVIF